MDLGLVLVQLVHIAGGAAWFGGSLFANLVLLPFIRRQPRERQRELIGGVVLGPERVMIAAALTAAISGLVRGIAFGRIDSPASLATPYGLVWLTSIVLAICVFGIGGRLTSPAGRALRDDDGLWIAGGRSSAHVERLRLGFRLELVGITAILALMVLLPRL